MSPEKDDDGKLTNAAISRDPRYQSHSLIDVATSRWNPFAKHSAVLLDLSYQGFKIEFVSPVKLAQGAKVKFTIPLAPFGILQPSNIEIKAEIKWYDSEKLRAGGVFENSSHLASHIIDKIVSHLEKYRSDKA